MDLNGAPSLVAGGASRLGAAPARALARRGARVAIVDLDGERANALAAELGGDALAFKADVTSEADVDAAVTATVEALGGLRFAASCAGIGWAERVVTRSGPVQLQPFETGIRVNLIGTFNVLRHCAAAMAAGEPDDDGERGAVVMTAS